MDEKDTNVERRYGCLWVERRPQQAIIINGKIIVRVLDVRVTADGKVVKLGIEAPKEIPVHRQEVQDEIDRVKREGGNSDNAQD